MAQSHHRKLKKIFRLRLKNSYGMFEGSCISGSEIVNSQKSRRKFVSFASEKTDRTGGVVGQWRKPRRERWSGRWDMADLFEERQDRFRHQRQRSRQWPPAQEQRRLACLFFGEQMNPTEFAEEVVMDSHQCSGFNLILVDLCSKSMIYVTNRPKDDEALVSEVPPGIHMLSNASLDTPCPKAVLLRSNFEKFLEKYGAGELPVEDLADELMTDTTKADKTTLPSIYSVEFEYLLRSIFVEANTKQGCYGTRSISAVSVKISGEVAFYEKYLEEECWKEHTVSYMMEQMGTS